MPRGWPETLWPPPILNLTMKDNLNPSSKSLHRTERPPPLLCHGDYGRVLEREQARLVIKGIASFLNTMKTEGYGRKTIGNGRLVEDLKEYSH